MAYTSGTAAPAMASGLGSDAGMREAASKRPAAAAGLGDGDRPARSPTAAAPPEEHEAPRLLPLPPPPPTDNNLMKEDSSLRVLVLQAADGSKISGDAEVEDYMHLLQAQVDLMATNNGLDSWEAEAQKTEKSFDVRNAVHKKHTGILVEFNSQTMAYLIFNHYAQHALILGFEHKVLRARDFYTELEPEMLLEENSAMLIIYLRNVPTIADVPAYKQQVIAHFKLTEEEAKDRLLRTEILRTELGGEKLENRDGAVQFIFENTHNIQTYPVIDMLLDGEKVGTFSAPHRQISIKGMDLCPDASCAAMGNMHKMGCKGKELKAQRQQAREFAKCKNFDKVLGANRAQAQALRIGFKQAAMAKKMLFCKMFNAKAVPCQGECMAYPCCEWPEIMETELDGTFYTELPAFRWPKRTSKPGKGAKEKRALRRATGNGAIVEEM